MKEMLREYQREMLSRLEKAWEKNRSVMVQMPTGTGKTWLMAEAIRNAQLGLCSLANEGTQGSGVIVVAHRRELIEQISKTLDKFGIEHGVILSGKKIDYSKRVQVASIQTLSRIAAHGDCPLCASPSWNPGLVIIDEAHHALATTYRMMWEWWPKAKFLGLTATPCRLNNAPFTDLFQTLLQSWSIQEFIDKGWLSDFEYVSASPGSEALKRVRSLKKRGADGDYQTKELATVMDVPESIEHLYKTYRQFACGKKGIVYAIDRRHAEHIADYYNNMGVRCAVIDSKTPAKERDRLV
jgi:superfamily II DNA or RNA helicase